MKIHPDFPQYTDFAPQVPVWCVTPNTPRTLHRFFDTPPFSPSGRFLICFQMPYEDRLPQPGDTGNIVLVDLEEGTERVVADTRGWEPQMGANAQWGADDDTVVYNDVDTDTWETFMVRLNPHTGAKERMGRGVYHVSPDGKYAVAARPERMRRTQYGYGVVIPDEKVPRNLDGYGSEGLWLTDIANGETKLLLSLADACAAAVPDARLDGTKEIYGFHSKWNVQGNRIMFTLRRYDADHPERWNTLSNDHMRFDVLSVSADGTEVHNAIPSPQWRLGGHHTHWYPDGEHLSFNQRREPGAGMTLMRVRYDGTDLRPITEAVPGSGHPTVHPDGRHILTDVYFFEELAYGDGTSPLRWIDRETGTESALARIRNETGYEGGSSVLRLDPHPAWDRDWKRFAFNACMGGTRRVYVADMSGLV